MKKIIINYNIYYHELLYNIFKHSWWKLCSQIKTIPLDESVLFGNKQLSASQNLLSKGLVFVFQLIEELLH